MARPAKPTKFGVDSEKVAKLCIGKYVEDAELYAEACNHRHRIHSEDGFTNQFTDAPNMRRINFSVIKGKVALAWLG
jgi:hypothetical protein